VIELCRRCGFDIPADAEGGCPNCAPQRTLTPSLPAQQVAGLALPTRSVQRLPRTRPRRDRRAPEVGPADGARSAFGYATLFLVLTLVAGLLGWAARLQRFVFTLPDGTADRLEDVAALTSAASLAGVAVGLLAMAAWTIRRVRVSLARRAERRLATATSPVAGAAVRRASP
jgi:hypothetical protein